MLFTVICQRIFYTWKIPMTHVDNNGNCNTVGISWSWNDACIFYMIVLHRVCLIMSFHDDVMSCVVYDRNSVSMVMETSCQHLTKMTPWLTSSLVLSCLWRLLCLLNMLCSGLNILITIPHGMGKIWLLLWCTLPIVTLISFIINSLNVASSRHVVTK